MARLIDVFVSTYNQVHAITEEELLPPCWRRHPGLATELAVHVWLWYFAHLDPTTSPAIAGDYYGRHLPGFQNRVDRLLGVSPREAGAVSTRTPGAGTPRSGATYDQLPTDPDRDEHDVDLLGELHFGFPHLTDAAQR